ncbi:hypothetical protein VTJ49DRAFT_1709 [Mycothermus thermophilus]|uniref:Uncharacterized protein n=1 Tax=Humicola insolens TaxID=85995 RepID=A0ABR3VCW5_HUMIN
MKLSSLLGALALSSASAWAEGIRGLFLYKDVTKSDTNAIRTSGYNTVLLFRFVPQSSGDILYTASNTPGSGDVMVATNGAYSGGDALAAKVRSLKDGGAIKRVEIAFDATRLEGLTANTNGASYLRFKANLAALKNAWNVDAVHYWEDYDGAYRPVLRFANIARDVGLKISGMGFQIERVSTIWEDLQEDVNKGRPADNLLFDRIYVKCFNDSATVYPTSFAHRLKMDTVPVLWTNHNGKMYNTSPDQARKKFTDWKKDQQYIRGGAFWRDSDIETYGPSYQAYGQVLREVFP